MNREIKLGIGVAILCICLFLSVIAIGNMSQKNSQNDTENSQDTTESSEVVGSDSEGTEVEDSLTEDEESEYVNFAIADVRNYVNVRKEPNTESDILGKIYDGAVAQILNIVGEGEDQWFQIISGNVEGYIKAEYFIHGDEAAAVMDEYVSKYIKVNVKRLNVRENATTDSRRIGYICSGEKLKLIEDCGEWLYVQYTDEIKGYVAAEYVTIAEEYIYAKNYEDEKIEREFIAELEDRAGLNKESENEEPENEESTKEDTTVTLKPPSTNYSTSVELRKAIIDYAMQFLGDKYVHGGQSLKTGTDCSGFTMYVLAEFGFSISRTPQGQYKNAGREISYSEVQPGDIICYSNNGGKSCTHVAFYIGDGKILHAANKRDGVKISSATNSKIIGVRNVID